MYNEGFENMSVDEKKMKFGNVLVQKSFEFGIRIVKSYKILSGRDKTIYPIYKQLLRSGTSIGANVAEAQSAFSKKEIISKLGISLKEAKESEYWLRLLKETDYLYENEYESLFRDCQELIKLLTAIIKTSKQNL